MDIGPERKVHEVKPRKVPYEGDEVERAKPEPQRERKKTTPKRKKEKVGA